LILNENFVAERPPGWVLTVADYSQIEQPRRVAIRARTSASPERTLVDFESVRRWRRDVVIWKNMSDAMGFSFSVDNLSCLSLTREGANPDRSRAESDWAELELSGTRQADATSFPGHADPAIL
jgi:hypothetical protein